MAEDYTSEIEEAGRIPETVPGFAERMLGDLHDEALGEQGEIWDAYEAKFDAALNRYLEDVGLMAARLERLGERAGADYLSREIAATTAEHNRFHDILNGHHPAVPED